LPLSPHLPLPSDLPQPFSVRASPWNLGRVCRSVYGERAILAGHTSDDLNLRANHGNTSRVGDPQRQRRARGALANDLDGKAFIIWGKIPVPSTAAPQYQRG